MRDFKQLDRKDLRISILGEFPPYRGGISHYNSELYKHLSKLAEIQIISYIRPYITLRNLGKVRKDNENIVSTKANFALDVLNPFSWIKTAKFISEFKPDLLILEWHNIQFSLPYYIILKRIRRAIKCKILVICHELLPKKKPIQKMFAIPLTKFALRNTDVIFVHSNQDYNIIKKVLPKIIVKKSFHPIYDFFYKKLDKSKTRHYLGVKGNVLLFFGYIVGHKGLRYLIDSLPDVLREIPVTLLVVGEFWENKEKYLMRIRKLELENNVMIVDRYVGNDEVAVYFSAADVVVTPYICASQSGVINIAYAFNKPVITANVGGLGEIVKDGKTGYVVKPRNSQELANAIIKFYKEDRSDVFEAAIRKFKKKFSWDRLCQKIIQELN